MPKRKIVEIDEDKCDGCAQCVPSCAEGAIQIIDGKARLVSEIYCDGLGACLGVCPQDAITVDEREAEEFDEAATQVHLDRLEQAKAAPVETAPSPAEIAPSPAGGFVCPGAAARVFQQPQESPAPAPAQGRTDAGPSQLQHWPVQLTLVPPGAPFFQGADVLLVADCVPFALPDFHSRYLKDKAIAIACPKLDDAMAHVDKLTDVLRASDIKSLTVLHMEVPCCTGLVRIAEAAIERSGKALALGDVTIGVRGDVLDPVGVG